MLKIMHRIFDPILECSFKSKIKFLKKCDIFGCPINLSMKNNDKHKTIFGGLLTVIIYMFFFAVLIYSFYKLFTKQNLETNKYQINLGSSYGHLNLDETNFMVAVKFDYNVLNNWTIPYMNITVKHVTQFRNSSHTWKQKNTIQMKRCEESDFVGLENDFITLGLSYALCPSSDSNMTIQGNFQEDIFAYFQIILTTCTTDTLCQTNETIYKEISSLDKLNIQFFITNNIIDETNYDQPVRRQIVSDMHFLIDPIKTVYRTADIFLNEVEIKTDGGFIPTLFSEPLPNITYTYNKEFREQTIFTSLDAASKVNIADFYFRKSQTKFTYDRFLGNLLTIISYLGGIWSTCYIVFSIIADNYSSYFFINSLSNKIYNYPSQLKRKKTVNYENQSISPSISPTKSREVKSIYNKIMEKIEIYLSYDRKLQLSFCGMWRIIIQNLFFFMKFNDEKYILMKKSEDNVMHDLDICNILKKLHEIDKIKTLLFSEEQQMMLGFSPKPEIFCSEADPSLFNRTSNGIKHLSKSMRLKRSKTKKKFLSEEINFDEIKPFKQLIFAWRNIKTSNQTSLNVNQNLLNMFGEHFSQIVDLSEEDMKIFCDQGKKVGSQLMNLAKAVQKAENGFKTFNGLIINEINPELSSHSENFINCGENTGELILGNSNRIEHISFTRSELEKDVKKEVKNKFIQIKGKLGLNYINNNEEEAKKLEIYKNNDPIIDCKTQRSKLFQDNFKEIHEKDQSKIKNFTVKDPILFTSTDRNLISQRDYLDSRRNQLNFKISTLDQEEGEENSIKRG